MTKPNQTLCEVFANEAMTMQATSAKNECCQTCGGSGIVTNWDDHTASASAWPPDNEKTCPECNGTGEEPTNPLTAAK